MLRDLVLVRDLVVLDLETTGLDPATDRVVEVCTLRLRPGGRGDWWTVRVNPGVPIPAPATRVHGITDAAVERCPTLDRVADELAGRLDGADWCGWNLPYDLALLTLEFARCGRFLPTAHAPLQLDPIRQFHREVPRWSGRHRDLAAAVRHYLGRDHLGPHESWWDCVETLNVLEEIVRGPGRRGPWALDDARVILDPPAEPRE